MRQVRQDLRFGGRTLANTPGFIYAGQLLVGVDLTLVQYDLSS